MGEPKNPHFYDAGISGRVPEPQNQLLLSLETPGYLNKIKKYLCNSFKTYDVYESHNSGDPFLLIVEKTGTDKSCRSVREILESLRYAIHIYPINEMEFR